MRDPWEDAELARRFREAGDTSATRAPLYAALATGVAADPALFRLLFHAPEHQRLPVLLFACVHALLLDDPDHRLAEWYPNLTEAPRAPDDPALLDAFRDLVDERAPSLLHLLATRSTQTNEVGRCLLLTPALGRLGDECGSLSHLDVGTSGGLTLLGHRYRHRYEPESGAPATELGPPSPVELVASTRGEGRLPARFPEIVERRGIDPEPIDVTDDEQARWLEACVWPDQADRFRRLRAAIAIAREEPPSITRGSGVDLVADLVGTAADGAHPVVTNTWVLNYLSPDERTAYVDRLDAAGTQRDLSWVFAEAPALTPELPWRFAADASPDRQLTAVCLVTWRDGVRRVEHLATSHPHGYWIHFHPTGGTPDAT